ncbi:MAG: hypothetical protein MMC23_004884 [Stictis urceolatum]|nr:hypothetical protein [Stictis urceolata]
MVSEHTPLSARPTSDDGFSSFEVAESPIQEADAPIPEGEEIHLALGHEGKEVHQAPELPSVIKADIEYISGSNGTSGKPPSYFAGAISKYTSASRPSGRRKRIWIPVLVLLALIAIIISLVLATRGSNSSHDSKHAEGGSATSVVAATTQTWTDAAIPATTVPALAPTDATEGTRLSTMNPKTGDVFLFYQVASGGIHYIALSENRVWQGANNVDVTNARNQTPLATTYEVWYGSTYWSIFYVDTDNTVQCRYALIYKQTLWHRDSIGDQEWKVPADPDITFVASYASDYNPSSKASRGRKSLYACGTDEVVHEYTYIGRSNEDEDSFRRPSPATNFMGLSNCGSGSFADNDGSAYLFTFDNDQTMEMRYRDYSQDEDDFWHESVSSP